MSDGRCTATTKDDTRCPNAIWRGSATHCWIHDPDNEESRRRASQRGAAVANSRYALGKPPILEPTSLAEARDLLGWLTGVAISDTEASSQRIREARQTIKDFMQAVDLAEMERRLHELERLAEEAGLI